MGIILFIINMYRLGAAILLFALVSGLPRHQQRGRTGYAECEESMKGWCDEPDYADDCECQPDVEEMFIWAECGLFDDAPQEAQDFYNLPNDEWIERLSVCD